MANISQAFIAKLAETINSHDVPCVLWGHCLLNVHGVPSIIGVGLSYNKPFHSVLTDKSSCEKSIDFVVPDERLEFSMDAISTCKDLVACRKPEICHTGSDARYTPPPAGHMHMQSDTNVTVGLYPQSETLWFLPPLAKVLPRTLHQLKASRFFVLASDSTVLPPWRPGRGSGVFADKLAHPVVVPHAVVLLEAYMRLYARDAGKQIGSFAMAMIAYMEQYVEEDGLLDVMSLPAPLRRFYQQLKSGETPVRQWSKELREALGVLG